MDMVQVLGVGVVGTLLAVTLSRINGTHGLLVGLATGCLLLVMLLGQTEELGSFFRELAGEGTLSAAYTGRAIRVLGLACLTEAGSRICRDGGQGNIALKVELCGRVLMLCAMLPALRELLEVTRTVLGELSG